MFEFGFTELCLIVVVAVFVIGPKDIPGLLQTLGRTARRLQYMKFALSQQFEDFMKVNDLNEIRHFSVDPMDNVNEKDADESLLMAPASPQPQKDQMRVDHDHLKPDDK